MVDPVCPSLEDHYELAEELGRGGFGVVWRARHRTTGEAAAIKLALTVGPEEDPRRVMREAEALADVRHPNLVRLEGVFQAADGRLALAYELVEGIPLDLACRDALPATPLALDWIEGVGAALDALHARGVVHRDVKPGNVMIEDSGEARLLDYGLVRSDQSGSTLTATGILVGTPVFMPPEVFQGGRVRAPGDLWALAALAYWLLEGEPPFHSSSPAEALVLRTRPPPPLRNVSPALAPALHAALSLGLKPDPAQRPATAAALVEALRRASEGTGAVPGSGSDSEDGTLAPGDMTQAVRRAPRPVPMTTKIRGAARPRNLFGGILLVGLVIGLLSGPGAGTPADDPADAATPAPQFEAPPKLAAPLADALARPWGMDGGDIVTASRPGARPLEAGDPIRGLLARREVPGILARLGELATGEAPETWSPAMRAELLRVDDVLRRAEQPPLFSPHLEVVERSVPFVLPRRLARRLARFLGRETPGADRAPGAPTGREIALELSTLPAGWAAAAGPHLEATDAGFLRLRDQTSASTERGLGQELSGTLREFTGGGLGGILSRDQIHRSSFRAEQQAALAAAAGSLQRALICLRRAAVAPGADAEAIGRVALATVRMHYLLLAGHLSMLLPEEVVGGPLDASSSLAETADFLAWDAIRHANEVKLAVLDPGELERALTRRRWEASREPASQGAQP